MNVRCRMRTAANIEILLVHNTDIWRRAYQVRVCVHTGTAAHDCRPPERICCAPVCLSVCPSAGSPQKGMTCTMSAAFLTSRLCAVLLSATVYVYTHKSDMYFWQSRLSADAHINDIDSVISRAPPHRGEGFFYLHLGYFRYYNARFILFASLRIASKHTLLLKYNTYR